MDIYDEIFAEAPAHEAKQLREFAKNLMYLADEREKGNQFAVRQGCVYRLQIHPEKGQGYGGILDMLRDPSDYKYYQTDEEAFEAAQWSEVDGN